MFSCRGDLFELSETEKTASALDGVDCTIFLETDEFTVEAVEVFVALDKKVTDDFAVAPPRMRSFRGAFARICSSYRQVSRHSLQWPTGSV